jgi:uncharacterized protein (DUF2141 family)
MRRVGLLALGLCTGATAAAPAEGHTITVRVIGLRSDKGAVYCRLFAGGEQFPKAGFVAQQAAKIAGGAASCTFAGVAAGTYAVSAYHDENGNGKLDTNFLGIPSEGVGVSNNRFPAIGPPKWKDAKFTTGGDAAIEIKLRY